MGRRLFPPSERRFFRSSFAHSRKWVRSRLGAVYTVLGALSLFLATTKPLGIVAVQTVPVWVSVPAFFIALLMILGKGAALAHREAVEEVEGRVRLRDRRLSESRDREGLAKERAEQAEVLAASQAKELSHVREQFQLANTRVEQLEHASAEAVTEEERELIREEAGAFLYHGNELLVRLRRVPPGQFPFSDNPQKLAVETREANDWAVEFQSFLERINKPWLVAVFRSEAGLTPPETSPLIGPDLASWIAWLKQRIRQVEKVMEKL